MGRLCSFFLGVFCFCSVVWFASGESHFKHNYFLLVQPSPDRGSRPGYPSKHPKILCKRQLSSVVIIPQKVPVGPVFDPFLHTSEGGTALASAGALEDVALLGFLEKERDWI